MFRYIVFRTLSMIPVIFGVSILVFMLIQFIPGDPAQTVLGADATEESLEKLRNEMGLNAPLYVQYFSWLGQLLQGDLGYSYTLQIPIKDELIDKFLNTIILAGASLFISVIFGVLFGAISGFKQRSFFDKTSMTVALLGASMPVFWIALMMMWLFSIKLQLLPVSGMYNMRNPGGLPDLFIHLILPAFATATVSLAVIARLSRSTIIEVIQKDYVRYFQSFGISSTKITIRHVMRNALAPIANISGLQVGYLMGGALFSEVVFNWPGVGLQMYKAIISNDYQMIQAGILIISLTFVIVNFAVDIFNIYFNPKLRDSLKA